MKASRLPSPPSPIDEESSISTSSLSDDDKVTTRGAGDNTSKQLLRHNHSVPELKEDQRNARAQIASNNALREQAICDDDLDKSEYTIPSVSIKCETSTKAFTTHTDDTKKLDINVRAKSLSTINDELTKVEHSSTGSLTNISSDEENSSASTNTRKPISKHNVLVECKALRNASVSRHKHKKSQNKESLRQKTLKKNCVATISKMYNLDIDPKYYEFIKIEQLNCADIIKELPNIKDLKEPPTLSPYSVLWKNNR